MLAALRRTEVGPGSSPGTSVDLVGCQEAFAGYALATLAAQAQQGHPVIAVAPDRARARALAEDARFFLGGEAGQIELFPDLDVLPTGDLAPDAGATRSRLRVLARLGEPEGLRAVVFPAAALLATVEAPSVLAARTVTLEVAGEADRDAIAERLVGSGYEPVAVVEDPATFAARGHLLDVFTNLYPDAVRVELYEILVESLRFFDAGTQRTLRQVERVRLPPVREEDRSSAGMERIVEAVHAATDAVDMPSRERRALLEEIESHSPLFPWWTFMAASHPEAGPVLDHVSADAQWLVVEPADCLKLMGQHVEEVVHSVEDVRERGGLCLPPQRYIVPVSRLQERLSGESVVRTRAVAVGEVPLGPREPRVERVAVETNAGLRQELERARGDHGTQHLLEPFVDLARERRAAGERVVLTTSSKQNEERMASLLDSYGLTSHRWRKRDAPLSLVDPGASERGPDVLLVRGILGRGFRLPGVLSLFSEEELLGRRARRRGRATTDVRGVFVRSWQDLGERDLCVHLDHGICAFGGLVTLDVPGQPGSTPFAKPKLHKEDFLLLEFAGQDRLYLPVHRLARVQRYASSDAADKIALDRLGSQSWEKTKGRIRRALKDMADELVKLHATRKLVEAPAFGAPDQGFREFEAAFPFDETPDQLKAIEEVLEDLARPTPADRLICGDVGFGKTEVAMRAAYLAVAEHRQVAVLCPTTVLAQQHAQTFSLRFQKEPVRVEHLSRFRTAAEIKEVLKNVAAGRVDIVIGTHRLLSRDVTFANLGLVIIDEEQRFGVTHKERLKQLRESAHVVTLAATPIPRTLHMSLMGLRDLSIIATPPEDRQAIRTIVVKQSDEVIQEAIARELRRGGQVFYLRNRVEGIEQIADHVRTLVPNARVAVGHGQLTPRQLDKVMTEFVAHRYDVLVCTTIIESGLDIPNANTLVVERADHFGLAQLYQIRGRVGRSSRRAFAYLLVPGEAKMTDDARRRLAALERFAELGAGFNIASYDLELRGAGNLLGGEQTGHIKQVGFELYIQLMEEAMAELRGRRLRQSTEPELKIDIEHVIPATYVEDTGQRLSLYKRLATCETEDGIDEIGAEMTDRYGEPLPDSARALLGLMGARLHLKRLGVEVLSLSADWMTLRFGEDPGLAPERVVELCNAPGSWWKLSPSSELTRQLPGAPKDGFQRIQALKRVLRELGDYANRPNPEHS